MVADLRSPSRAVLAPLRGRGRPALVEPTSIDEYRTEVQSLRAEARAAENVISLARFVQQRAAIDCGPDVVTAQGAVVSFLERQCRRGGGDSAA